MKRGVPATSIRAPYRRLEEDPRGKLPPEVMDGFARILKSFYNLGLKPPIVSTRTTKPDEAKPIDATDTHATDKARDQQLEEQKAEEERKRQQLESERLQAEEAAKLAAEKAAADQRRGVEYQAKSVTNPFQQLLTGDQVKALQADQEHRYSPEPPRVEDLSDEEDGRYEDPGMRAARLEKERLAREEAERRAALLREEEERVASQRKGVMNLMQNEADSILSKYQ